MFPMKGKKTPTKLTNSVDRLDDMVSGRRQ